MTVRPGAHTGPEHRYRGQLRATVAASAAPHGYTLALWTATAVTSSDRGAPGAAEVLAFLTGATLTFVALSALAYSGAPMAPDRSAANTRPWAAFHLPMAALAALVSLLLARCCSGPLLWGLVGTTTTAVYLLGVSAQFLCFAVRRVTEKPQTLPPERFTMSPVLDPAAQDLLFREARTANTFTDEPVTDDQIEAIYDLVKYGPTSMNQQPLRIVLVRSAEARERLLEHMSEANRKKTAAAPLVAILAADNEFHEELPIQFPHFPQAKDLFAERAVRERSAKLNALIQVGYFIIGVRAAGLAAGPMTGFDAEGIDKEFFGDGEHAVLAVVNIGRPGENAWFTRSPRLAYEQVVSTV
jgi:3-hydroxypropanoate dehydrogenase